MSSPQIPTAGSQRQGRETRASGPEATVFWRVEGSLLDLTAVRPVAFFTWHDKIEDQHKAHVWEELKACYQSPKFSEEPFVWAGVTMLDGVKVFWDGLNMMRQHSGRVAA